MDQELDNGPLGEDRRHCTDILFYGLWVLFCCGMIVIAIYGWAKGNPDKYLSGVDDDGNFCGYTKGYEDYERLYFPDLSSASNVKNKYVCVKGD